ncbi:MAG: 50S ribosomal protein L35 [Bdellovibrionales bacterium]|nr:50S ribosomal protein L35 [Bdellovibrionales bacterium]
MKQKTHSGAKKRFRVKASGKIKYKKPNLRHILEKKNAKRKRHLAKKAYVNPSNEYQVKRQLVL